MFSHTPQTTSTWSKITASSWSRMVRRTATTRLAKKWRSNVKIVSRVKIAPTRSRKIWKCGAKWWKEPNMAKRVAFAPKWTWNPTMVPCATRPCTESSSGLLKFLDTLVRIVWRGQSKWDNLSITYCNVICVWYACDMHCIVICQFKGCEPRI